MAASRGKIGVVVSITALYPLITILLAFFFLKEPLTFKQLLGMFFSLVAILLFTT
jgi:transporter family protein